MSEVLKTWTFPQPFDSWDVVHPLVPTLLKGHHKYHQGEVALPI